ncbi:MAG TPA: hypothetical protein VF875_13140 [Anaeromyxobacter sp.]
MTKRTRIAHLALLLTAACAVYANSIGNDFVWDDVDLIKDNPVIRDLGNLPKLATTSYWDLGRPGERVPANYRPLTVATFLLNYQIAGADPAAFRVVNVALHAASTCLVYLLCAALGVSGGAALAAGLLFAVHPVHVEAVVWITGRAELLASLGVLAAALLHLRQRRDGSPSLLAAAVACFVLALLSKESAIAFVAIVVCLELTLAAADGATVARLRSRLLSCLPYVVACLAYLGVRWTVVGVEDRGSGVGTFFAGSTAPEIFLTMVKVFARYWGLLLFPVKLSAHYDQVDVPLPETLLEPSFLAAVAVNLAVLVAIVALFRTRRHLAAFALAWVPLALLPYSHLIHFEWLMAERFLYLASIGISLGAALAIDAARRTSWARPRPAARALVAAGVCALGLLAVRTLARNRDWAHETDFFAALAREKPNLPGARLSYGKALWEAGRYDEAIVEYEEVLRLSPDVPGAAEGLRILRFLRAAQRPVPRNEPARAP